MSVSDARKILPQVAQTNDPILELMMVIIPAESLSEWITAQKIELRLGDSTFTFTEDHRRILEDFLRFVLPEGEPRATQGSGFELISPVLPLELKGASREKTLSWLAAKLKQVTTRSTWTGWQQVRAADFSSCKIKLSDQYFSSFHNVAPYLPYSKERTIDLTETAPNSISAVTYDDQTRLYLRTNGGNGRSWILLGSAKLAAEYAGALKQAAELCQPVK